MKKLIIILVCAATLFISGCSLAPEKTHKYTDLKYNEVLVIGDNSRFMNHKYTETSETSIEYTVSVKYTLRRTLDSYYSSPRTCVQYNDYYYYWETSNLVTDNLILGNKTVTKKIWYAYLPYGENENISVKTTVQTETSYNYAGGWIEKPFDCQINLCGFFASFDELAEKCPDLAGLIDSDGMAKYYIDVTTPSTTQTSFNTYTSTYYYFENNR